MAVGGDESMKTNKVVLITGPGFEDPEVIYPYYRLQEEGVIVEVATSNNIDVKGKYGYPMKPTVQTVDLKVENYDAVVIPGGHEAPDRVRQVKEVVEFVRNMMEAGKVVSSTCHGPWVLIEANIVRDKKATCYPGMKTDLINAGAIYEASAVVVDGNLVTSDHPRSLGPWMKATIAALQKIG